jgi:DNA-binding transcriptional ArsR family regulator
MPIFEEPERAVEPKVAVHGSAAIELEWLLHSAVREDFRVDHHALHALYDDERPELRDAVQQLWADEEPDDAARAPGAFTELVLVAHHGGLLFEEDPSKLLSALGRLCSTVPTGASHWPLVAETDVDRRTTLVRLARLRRSAEARRRFVDVVSQVWEAAAPSWEQHGRAAVAEAIASREAMLAKGAGWRDLVKGSWQFGEHAERVVATLAPGDEVVVVPAYFAHLGLLYDVPGCVVLGIRAEEAASTARARNEDLSKRLRALSDPTRLAIVDSLRDRALTVTDLATRFGLAQPTVSNHVKLLRDAGIVAEVRDGTRKKLVVRREQAGALVDDLARVLAATSRSTSARQ